MDTSTYIVIGLSVWIVLIALVICAAILGGRLDDRIEQEEAA